VLYYLLAAFGLSACSGRKRTAFAGASMGLACMLRPFLALLLVPFLLFRRRAYLLGVAAACLIGWLVPVLLYGSPSIWSHYAEASALWTEGARNLSNRHPTLPGKIEGLRNLAVALPLPDADSSVNGLLIANCGLMLPSWAMKLAVLGLILGWIAWAW